MKRVLFIITLPISLVLIVILGITIELCNGINHFLDKWREFCIDE